MRKFEIQEISTGELFAKFEAMLKDSISGIKVGINNESLKLFTRKETVKILKGSLPKFNSWAKKGVFYQCIWVAGFITPKQKLKVS